MENRELPDNVIKVDFEAGERIPSALAKIMDDEDIQRHVSHPDFTQRMVSGVFRRLRFVRKTGEPDKVIHSQKLHTRLHKTVLEGNRGAGELEPDKEKIIAFKRGK